MGSAIDPALICAWCGVTYGKHDPATWERHTDRAADEDCA